MNTTETIAEMGRGRTKAHGSLAEVVAELRRQIDARSDFTASTLDMEIKVADDGELVLCAANSNLWDWLGRGVKLLPAAVRQLCDKAPPGVLWKQAARLLYGHQGAEKNPQRLADLLTGLMHDDPRRRSVRLLDGACRAFLSSTYKPYDSVSIAGKVLSKAKEADARVLEASLTDHHLRVKLIDPGVYEELERVRTTEGSWFSGGLGKPEYLSRVAANSVGKLPGGPNVVHPILTVENSETGHGKLNARAGILQGVCFNTATVEEILALVHLGSEFEEGLWSQATLRLVSQTVYAKIDDCLAKVFDPEAFRVLVDKVRGTVGQPVSNRVKAGEIIIEASDCLAGGELDDLVEFFSREPGEASVYNLGQAVSRMAQEADHPDVQAAREKLAGQLITGQLTQILKPALTLV